MQKSGIPGEISIRSLAVGLSIIALAMSACNMKYGDPRPEGIVRVFQQGDLGRNANTFMFQTPAGPVLIDTPVSISEAKALRASLERPYRIFVTGAKPERFGGLNVMRVPDVPTVSTPAIASEIETQGFGRLAQVRKRNAQDVAASVKPPVPSIDERTHDMVSDVEVDMLPIVQAESPAQLVLFLPKTKELIAGDLVFGPGEHPELVGANTAGWQLRLAELKALEPRYVYPGRGEPGGPELIDGTVEYLKHLHDAVAEKVKPQTPLTVQDRGDIHKHMVELYPKWRGEERLDRSITAEYGVQLAALAVPPPAPAAADEGDDGLAPPSGKKKRKKK